MSLTPFLTDDLVIEILQRLPVKPLLRCKSVSKPWLSLISSPSFIKSQLSFAIATTTASAANQTLIAHSSDTLLSLINLASQQTVAHLDFPFSEADEPPVSQGDVSDPYISIINAACRQLLIQFPEREGLCLSDDALLVGSACGIVCVRSRCDNLYLWNPATKQSKIIPSPKLDSGVFRDSLGFGFDQIGDDFKIVRVVLPYLYAEVYSANMNVWRLVEVEPIDMPGLNNDFEVCLNGFLCSVGSRHGMMTFDLNKEVFTCGIKLPATTFGTSFEDIKGFGANARITDFNDCISVIIYKNYGNGCKINLWMLDDEACFRRGGFEASWTLMLNIDVSLPVLFVHGYFNSGDILLLLDDDDDWCLYDPYTKELSDFSHSILTGQIFKYTESLVSIPGSKLVNWSAHN